MMRLAAAWVVPIDRPPIRDGWVAVEGDRIVELGQGNDPDAQALGPLRGLGRVALLPGLVNAHTHLELSWLRGRVPPANAFRIWRLVARWATAAGAGRGPAGGPRPAGFAHARACPGDAICNARPKHPDRPTHTKAI